MSKSFRVSDSADTEMKVLWTGDILEATGQKPTIGNFCGISESFRTTNVLSA